MSNSVDIIVLKLDLFRIVAKAFNIRRQRDVDFKPPKIPYESFPTGQALPGEAP